MTESATPGFYESVIPILPAFKAYERGLVDWMSGITIPREGRNLRPKVMYAGGEKAVLAVKAMTENRNDRAAIPIITIRLADIAPNTERYSPPESYVGIVYNGPKATATRAARVSKPAGYKVNYEVKLYPAFEEDHRYMMFNLLQRFHHHGGNLSYLTLRRPDGAKEFFPLWMRSYSNGTTAEAGEGDRQVIGMMNLELEAYLPLPLRFVPTFRSRSAKARSPRVSLRAIFFLRCFARSAYAGGLRPVRTL